MCTEVPSIVNTLSGIARSYDKHIFTYIGNGQTLFQNVSILCILTTEVEFRVSHVLASTWYCLEFIYVFLILASLIGLQWYLIVL